MNRPRCSTVIPTRPCHLALEEIGPLAGQCDIDPATAGLPAVAQRRMFGLGQALEGLAASCPQPGVHDVAKAARLAAPLLPVLTIQ
jgi:hypothetical protein